MKESSNLSYKYRVDLPGVWGRKSLTEIGLSDSETKYTQINTQETGDV